ncbi:protein of unknown function [Methylocella tundrae]|uniref:Uncharacterized protein n=1 Tax=Methylocella tundrae TaxID=227605 RepID=A0A4V6IM83_METTU|nr:protein of unknown function [Methylocella tundrae]
MASPLQWNRWVLEKGAFYLQPALVSNCEGLWMLLPVPSMCQMFSSHICGPVVAPLTTQSP